jgi:hypothetical protein
MSKKFTTDEIYNSIKDVYAKFRSSRAYFPYIRESDLTKTLPPPFTIFNDIEIQIKYNHPIDEIFRDYNNSIGHFLNQNFLLRLFAVLQYHGIYDGFDKTRYKKLQILKQLRNEFGHGLGTYNPTSPKDKKLMKNIVTEFNLPDIDYSDFPISIDTVINEIVNESLRCVTELSQKPKPKISLFRKFVYLPIKSLFVCLKIVNARLK